MKQQLFHRLEGIALALMFIMLSTASAWADTSPSLELKHAFGDKATVTFYLYSPTIFDEKEWRDLTNNDINTFLSSSSVQKMNEYATVVAHVVPATGYWTNEALLFARMTAKASIVQTRGVSIDSKIKVNLLQLDDGRNDGAGWYYIEMGEQFDPEAYGACLLDGYVLPKFDLSEATASKDGLTYTMTEGDWTTTLTIDEGKNSFEYNGSEQGPTKLTSTSIIVKRDGAETLTFAKVSDHVTAAVNEKPGSSRKEGKAIDAGSYALTIKAASTDVSATVAVDGANTRATSAATIESGIFTNSKDVDFTITQKEVKIVPTVNNKVYDGKKDATIASATITTGIDGEALNYVSGLTAEFEDAKVGTGKSVDITGTPTVEKGNDNTKVANYTFVAEDVKADITKKALTIKAEPKSKVYGEKDPTLTYTKEGLLEGDAITGALTRAKGENIGGYAITQGDLSAGENYTITYTGANLIITKKALTIKAEPKSKVYGEKDPTLTYTKEGLLEGDAITGALTRAEGEDVGGYAITQGDLSAGENYTITYTGANLTITKKALTIKADAKEKVAGEEDPELTYTKEGLLEGDAITGALARAEGENVGEYDITLGTLSAGDNYTITYTGAKLTIKAADFADSDVTAKAYEGTYDGKPHTIEVKAPKSATIEYSKDGNTYGLKEAPTYTNAGEYTVYYKVTKANTNPVFGSKTVVIKKAKLTITANPMEKVEGDADPPLTYVVEGLVEGDELTGALSRAKGEEAGEYAITQGTLKASDNYEVTFTGAKLTIKAKEKEPEPTPPAEPTYKIIVDKSDNGEVVSTMIEAAAGDRVGLVAKPDKDYHLASLSIRKVVGGEVALRVDQSSNMYFLMPASDVFVKATFEKNEEEQNIFIQDAKYGEIISHVLHAEPGAQVNMRALCEEDAKLDIDQLSVVNNLGEQLEINTVNDPTEGLVYFFFMKGESVSIFSRFKGTNNTVDESQPLPPDNLLYLMNNDNLSFLNVNGDANDVQLAMPLVANILAKSTSEGELQVRQGEDDLDLVVLNLKSGWQIKVDFTGDIRALNPNLLEGLGADGTVEAGVLYKMLTDGNLELSLKSSSLPQLIKSITIIVSKPDDPTAIHRLQADDADADIYDLNGRKVDTTIRLPKGVYIRNGRKVVIK